MTTTQEKIFEVFREFKIQKNGRLQFMSFNILSWDKLLREDFRNAMEDLISEKYIVQEKDCYVLTKTGYNYIYRNYSIDDTRALIMDVFQNYGVGVGEVLMQNSFFSWHTTEDRFHIDNLGLAMKDLISEGLIEITETGNFKLTKFGYDKIYGG